MCISVRCRNQSFLPVLENLDTCHEHSEKDVFSHDHPSPTNSPVIVYDPSGSLNWKFGKTTEEAGHSTRTRQDEMWRLGLNERQRGNKEDRCGELFFGEHGVLLHGFRGNLVGWGYSHGCVLMRSGRFQIVRDPP